jgi:hypothetical protein
MLIPSTPVFIVAVSMEALQACIPVSGLVRLIISYTEPLEWWRFIPDIEQRLDLARHANIEVKLGPVWSVCVIPPLTLNSPLALFGTADVTFSSGNWECRGFPLLSSWWLRDTKSGVSQLHRIGDEPAKITLLVTGTTRLEWTVNGAMHRDGDLPASVEFGEAQWIKNGKKHRDGHRPAVIQRDGLLQFFEHGRLTRELRRAGRSPFLRPVKYNDGWNAMLDRLEETTSLAHWKN